MAATLPRLSHATETPKAFANVSPDVGGSATTLGNRPAIRESTLKGFANALTLSGLITKRGPVSGENSLRRNSNASARPKHPDLTSRSFEPIRPGSQRAFFA